MIRFPKPKVAAARFRGATKSRAERRAAKLASREELAKRSFNAGRPIHFDI